MNNIICNNPYRTLGVFSNATQKEISASLGKMKAFLKVGKEVSFDLDLNKLVGKISRSPEDIEKAQAALTLPSDRIKYAQFWFIKQTSFDEIAISNLVENDASKAKEILSKKSNFSSLNNFIVLSLILKEYSNAIKCAESFYNNPDTVAEFVNCILDDKANIDSSILIDNFLEYLKTQLPAKQLVGMLNRDWAMKMGGELSKPIIDELNKNVEDLKGTKRDNSVNHIEIGLKSYQNTKQKLAELKALLPDKDTRYTVIADKYSQFLLQCAIQKFNSMELPCKEDIQDCLELAKKALDISEGDLVKERIKDNLKTFEETYNKAVPQSVLNKIDKAGKLFSKLLSIQGNISDYSLTSCLNLAREIKLIFSDLAMEYSDDDNSISQMASATVALFVTIICEKRKVLERHLRKNPSSRDEALNNLVSLRSFDSNACDLFNILSAVDIPYSERQAFERIRDNFGKEKNSLDTAYNNFNNQMKQASSGCAVVTAGFFFLFFSIIVLGIKGISALV